MDKTRWILVSDGTPQMLYAGKTALSEEAIDTALAENLPIELMDCRAMRTLLMPGPNNSVNQNEVLSPISIARTGVRLKIKALSYFWPDEDEPTYNTLMSKVGPTRKAELRHRAAEAGLITVDNTPPIPGGKLLS